LSKDYKKIEIEIIKLAGGKLLGFKRVGKILLIL